MEGDEIRQTPNISSSEQVDVQGELRGIYDTLDVYDARSAEVLAQLDALLEVIPPNLVGVVESEVNGETTWQVLVVNTVTDEYGECETQKSWHTVESEQDALETIRMRRREARDWLQHTVDSQEYYRFHADKFIESLRENPLTMEEVLGADAVEFFKELTR